MKFGECSRANIILDEDSNAQPPFQLATYRHTRPAHRAQLDNTGGTVHETANTQARSVTLVGTPLPQDAADAPRYLVERPRRTCRCAQAYRLDDASC